MKPTGEYVREYSQKTAKWLLLLLLIGGKYRRYNAPVEGKTRFMKMLFLLETRFKHVITPRHDFFPYKFGPHSAQVHEELEELKQRGLVDTDPTIRGETFYLTPLGVDIASQISQYIDPSAMEALRNIKSRYNDMPLNALLHMVYDQYPNMAVKSEYEENAG